MSHFKRFALILIAGLLFESNAIASTINQHAKFPTNSLGINVLGLVDKSVTVNYEHLFKNRHGMFVEAGMGSEGEYSYQIAYLRHSSKHKDKKGISAPYWGPFIRISKTVAEFEDDKINKSYELDYESLNIGLLVGKSYSLGRNFRFNWQFGYGLPLNSKLEWDDDSYKDKKLVEDITRFITGFEGGISIGVVF